MCVKIAAMVRTLPVGLACQAAGARLSMIIRLIRSFAAKMVAASRPGFFRAVGTALLLNVCFAKRIESSPWLDFHFPVQESCYFSPDN
jgi:hypothetical protein